MKLILCALCALLGALPALAFPTPAVGVPPECIDPTFACQDLESAKLCKVVKTCIHDVWSTMSVPDPDNDEVCDICKEMVKEARDQLLSNMTQEEIKEVFEGSCKLLPVKLIADACIKVVDEIIPQLVEMLASRMDPTMVCTVSGMCFATKKDMGLERHILKFVKDFFLRHKEDQCSECTTMVTDLQVFLKSTSQSDVKSDLEKFCHQKMPSYLCDIVVNSYFSEIYNLIMSTEPSKLCGSVGICPQKCDTHSGAPKVEDELTCEFCEHLLQHVKDLITTNTTMDEFKTALLNFCNRTGKYSQKCMDFVNSYYDMLFTYIKQLDTRGMCTLMGLCQNTRCTLQPLVKIVPAREGFKRIPLMELRPARRPLVDLELFPLVRLVPAEMLSKKEMRDSNDIFQLPLDRLIHPVQVFQKDTECALCKAFSFYLEQDLAGDKTKVGVREVIDGVCGKWMHDYPEQCSRIVELYSMKIQMAIAKGISFDALCSEVKACPLEEDKSGELNVKVIPKVGESPFCDLCKEAMNEVQKELSDPATKQKLKDAVDQVCNILPKSLKDDCVSFVNQNVDALIDILQQELKPDNICPALKLCGEAVRICAPSRVKDLECDVCKDVVTSFRTKLQDPASKEIIQTFLEEGCIRLPDSVASECKKFVDDNIDYLMKVIQEEMDPQKVCSILNICPAQIKVEKPKVTNDVECELCKEVVGKVEDMVKDKKTEDEIKAALDSVCSYLPSSLSGKCVNFVNQYTEIIVTLLMQELDPNMVCASLNLCPSQIKVKKPEVTNDVECELCKEVVGKVEDMVKDKKTEDEIKAALDSVCSYLPSSLSGKCVNFVNQYTDIIVTLLMQELDPNMVCASLNLCPSQVKVEKPKDVECDLCKEVVGKVEDMIKDKKTEDEIKAALDKVCSYLPSSLATKCEGFVNQYTDLLIELLSQELDPQMVCAALKVCPENSLRFAEWKAKAVDLECQGCQYALHFLQEQLMSNDTQDAVKNVLKKMCNVLPKTYASNCEAFVDEYGSSLLVLVAQEIDPSTMCYQLQMCSNQTLIPQLQQKSVTSLTSFPMDECSVCTTVVDYVDKLLEEDDVDKEITKLVEKVCVVVPTSFRDKCTSMLETYGPYILQMIGQVANSKQLCQEIDMCARTPGHVHLIGGSKCTFGPSYWCRSTAHAAACKAELYCKSRVWAN